MKFNDRLGKFSGRSVFVTGHTGFKGSWLSLWLAELGAEVTGFSLEPPTSPNNFELSGVMQRLAAHHEADVRDLHALKHAIQQASPDVVFHLAAQSLVLEGYRAPRETFETNVMGTVNVLDAVRELGRPCAVVVVTSDKCYENQEWQWGYRETDPLGGRDPYSASKGATEIVVSSYRRSFFPTESLGRHGVRVASARAGNVIGGGDWSPNHIVVDIVTALTGGQSIGVRNPQAIRPWQHVLESLSGYLTLASALMANDAERYCDSWNFGPRLQDSISVQALVEQFIDRWGDGGWTDTSDRDQPHEAGMLRLAIEKAESVLDWHPRWNVPTAVQKTVAWYKAWQAQTTSPSNLCLADIRSFVAES